MEIESAVIDLIGIDKLTNRVKGHHSSDRGRMPLEEIEIMYGAEEVTFGEPAILLKIGQRYKENMSDEEMYLATKDAWSVSLDKVKGRIGIACSVYRKVIGRFSRLTTGHVTQVLPTSASLKVRSLGKRYETSISESGWQILETGESELSYDSGSRPRTGE